jgi:hypothetical protein
VVSWEESAAPDQEIEGTGHCLKVQVNTQKIVTFCPDSRVLGMKTSGF